MSHLRPDDPPEVEARLLRKLYELSRSSGRTLDPGQLITLAAEHACELLHGDAVALYLWDESAGLLMPVFSTDQRPPVDDQPLRPGQGAAGQAVLHRQPVVVDDYANWAHAVDWAVARQLKSVEAVPLVVRDRSIGALVVRFYTQRHVSGEQDAHTLQSMAALLAPALEAARLYATSTLERQHERALREITQALAANLDERKVLDLAVGYGARLLRSPYARVWLVQPNGELSCAAAEGYVQPETFSERLTSDSISGEAARQQIVNLANAPAEAGWKFNREFGERTGLGAYIGAGLWRAGQSVGVLEMMRESGDRFTALEEQLLLTLANTVAVAVSNARTHAAVERLADEAQRRALAVAQSELLLRSVYAAIGSGVVVFDGDGKIVNANTAAQEILGRRVDELLGMRQTDFLTVREDGSALEAAERPHTRAVASGQAVRKHVVGITRPDGARRWLQVDAVPIFEADGGLARVISSFIDISDRKRTEEALRQRDTILEAVAFAAEEVLTSSDWEHSIEAVLCRLGAATGASRVYIVGGEDGPDLASHYEWVADGIQRRDAQPRGAPYLEAMGLGRWEPILREGGVVQGPLRSFPDHEQVTLQGQGISSIVAVPIFAGGAWWGFIGFDDCAEQRDWSPGLVEVLKTAAGTLGAAVLRRRAEAERLQLVREQSARAEAESAQRRVAFLAEASQILAASLDYELTLQGVADLVVPAHADRCFVDVIDPDGTPRRVASAPRGRMTSEVDRRPSEPVVNAVRTGQSWWAESRLAVPLVTSVGVAGTITWEVSDGRPRFRRADLELAQDLARRCALAVDNARLYAEARAAVGTRDEFLSVAAHELKTPLTSLRGYAQLLARELETGEASNPERARRAAVTIQVQSDKLARLIGQLLDVSRIQSGRLAIERRETDLSALAREIIEAARDQMKEHILSAQLPAELWVRIDPLRVEQVLTNLIDNAVKYSPEGGQIDVSLAYEGEMVELTVQDRGIGVPIQHRKHIFDRFYQAHAGGALTSMAGMGLGLYISRQIVELHGGTIEAEFPDEGGTRFVVRLPAVRA